MIRVHVRRGWLGLGALAALVALAALSGALSAPARSAGRPADGNAAVSTAFPGASWAGTGGDLANSRYSTLTRVTRGNVKKLKELPPGCRKGQNSNAFVGGFRLWEDGDGKGKDA